VLRTPVENSAAPARGPDRDTSDTWAVRDRPPPSSPQREIGGRGTVWRSVSRCGGSGVRRNARRGPVGDRLGRQPGCGQGPSGLSVLVVPTPSFRTRRPSSDFFFRVGPGVAAGPLNLQPRCSPPTTGGTSDCRPNPIRKTFAVCPRFGGWFRPRFLVVVWLSRCSGQTQPPGVDPGGAAGHVFATGGPSAAGTCRTGLAVRQLVAAAAGSVTGNAKPVAALKFAQLARSWLVFGPRGSG